MIVGTRLGSLDRNLVEASSDLYATPLTTFRSIVLPQIMPAVIAGFLLAFTFSFDDFIVAFFVAGSAATLPIYVFASIRRGSDAGNQRHRDDRARRLGPARGACPDAAAPAKAGPVKAG